MEADQLRTRNAIISKTVESIRSDVKDFQKDIQEKLQIVLEQASNPDCFSCNNAELPSIKTPRIGPRASSPPPQPGSIPGHRLSNPCKAPERRVEAKDGVPIAENVGTAEADNTATAEEKPLRSSVMSQKTVREVKTKSVSLKLDARWVGLQRVTALMDCEKLGSEDSGDHSSSMSIRKKRQSLAVQWDASEFPDPHRWFHQPADFTIHPHSSGCITWDCVGLVLLLYDVVAMPLTVAWDLTLDGFMLGMCILSVVYWTLDMVRTFYTGVYEYGELVLKKWRIAQAYLRSWFLIDICLIVIDYMVLSITSDTDELRILRFFRLLRLSRSLKVKKRFDVIIDACSVSGGWVMIILVAFMQTFSAIVMGAHIIACTWFYIGKESLRNGGSSWLQEAELIGASMHEQYGVSFHWVLCQFTPAPIIIGPTNTVERSFNIVIIVFSLAVMGSLISQMGVTMQKLSAMSSENAKKLTEVRRYLYSNSIPIELSARIVRFADFTLQNRRSVALDYTLMSASLQKELLMQQRRPLIVHPLFLLLEETSQNVFCEICGMTNHNVYGKDDVVFTGGAVAEGLVITISGTWELVSGSVGQGRATFQHSSSELPETRMLFKETRWFCEVSLFCTISHSSTLTAEAIGDVFYLTGADLVQCLRGDPVSSRMVCEYCKGFLSELGWRLGSAVDLLPEEVAEHALKGISYYKRQNIHTPILSIDTYVGTEYPDTESVNSFVQRILDGDFADDDISYEVTKVFPELQEQEGPYARFREDRERMCCIASIMSVVWLVKDEYSNFVHPQPVNKRMSLEKWLELQQFIKWVNLSIDEIQAVFVFLAIRGLGKVRLLVEQLPAGKRRPEIAVQHLMEENSQLVPSAMRMSDEMRKIVDLNLSFHMHFNFAQMLQAENTPLNVQDMQDYIEQHGVKALKFYMLSMLAMMCGLTADPATDTRIIGSRFMGQKMSCIVLLCIQALQQVGETSPSNIYFGYITLRGKQLLGMSITSNDELALARLAILNRVESPDALAPIAEAWASLSFSDREILTDHLLRDGIMEKSMLLSFLPLYFTSARENSNAGLITALSLVADLILKLRVHPLVLQTYAQTRKSVVTVDVSDLAMFISSAQSSSLLLGCIEDAHLDLEGTTLRLSLTSKNWGRVHDDGHNIDMGNALERMMRKQQAVENMVKVVEMELKSANVPRRESMTYGSETGSAYGFETSVGMATKLVSFPAPANQNDFTET